MHTHLALCRQPTSAAEFVLLLVLLRLPVAAGKAIFSQAVRLVGERTALL